MGLAHPDTLPSVPEGAINRDGVEASHRQVQEYTPERLETRVRLIHDVGTIRRRLGDILEEDAGHPRLLGVSGGRQEVPGPGDRIRPDVRVGIIRALQERAGIGVHGSDR
jgi:hypothetical protein